MHNTTNATLYAIDLLGLELLVVDLGIKAHELKLLSGNFRHMIIISHFLDPILILGSMKP